jgi:hypothetical protein
VAQVVQSLPSKCEALSSNPSTAKQTNKQTNKKPNQNKTKQKTQALSPLLAFESAKMQEKVGGLLPRYKNQTLNQ